MADEEQPAAVLLVPNEAAGTRLQATGSSRVSGVRRPSASNYLTWAGDIVKDEPIADKDANKLIKEAMDDTSLNSSSMLAYSTTKVGLVIYNIVILGSSVIPIAVLFALTVGMFAGSIKEYRANAEIHDALLFSMQASDAVHDLQLERDMTAFYIGTYRWARVVNIIAIIVNSVIIVSVIVFAAVTIITVVIVTFINKPLTLLVFKISAITKSDIVEQYRKTDATLDKLSKWPVAAGEERMNFLTKDDFVIFLNHHRYQLRVSNTNEKNELATYSAMISQMMNWLTDAVNRDTTKGTWKELVALLQFMRKLRGCKVTERKKTGHKEMGWKKKEGKMKRGKATGTKEGDVSEGDRREGNEGIRSEGDRSSR
ncbi:hypothetical protein LSAT2_016501 [Lamellibrachia satsuma]|nr:hypothetical protein LSAT2_016501 [Lamellibrachia satsuma]